MELRAIRSLVQLVVLFGAVCSLGCSMKPRPSATKISEFRSTIPVNRDTVELTVARQDFQAAVERTQHDDRLRIVPVFRRERAGGGIPEYRLFDVGQGTPYGLLGLQTADILVAANDYLIYDPEGFRKYVKLLGRESVVSIEVIRGGRSMLLRSTFSE